MREAEGQAFARASRTTSVASEHNYEEGSRPPSMSINDSPQSVRTRPVSPESLRRPTLEYSPAGSIASVASGPYSISNQSLVNVMSQNSHMESSNTQPQPGSTAAAASNSMRFQDVVAAASEDALNAFVARTTHLWELFRLHAETFKPLMASSLKDSGRAALWWFLKGRTGLETAIREKPTTSQSQMQNELDRQQAYTNLAKGYWLSEEVIPEVARTQNLPPDPELVLVTQSLVSALRKLAISMQRNGFLPPEEAFLPQTIDKSIWVEYPLLSQDMISLLSGNASSGLAVMQQPTASLPLLSAFPVADTGESFNYGRISADCYLMEQSSRDSQRLHFPSILSMLRPQTKTGLFFVLASQNGSIQLTISDSKQTGPVWDDIRWRSDTCTIDVRLPRGFMLVVQLAQQDYRMLWSMYDFGTKVRGTLYPRNDESPVFRSILRSFQYIDADPQSRTFPKEAVPHCEMVLFERIAKEAGPAGPRNWHNGFRIAVVTGPRTRTLSGVHHAYPPVFPVQFGFFRAEGEAPALSLKYDNGRHKGRMVLIFNDEKERLQFHSLLTGTSIDPDEKVYSDVPLKSYTVSQSLREPAGIAPFSRMPWRLSRVVNDEFTDDGGQPATVLADKLKIVLEYQNGSVTDRVNVGPGELRVRLEVSNAKVFRVLRQPQRDMTTSASEAQVPKELARSLSDALQLLATKKTIRSLEFGNLKDLHDFQAALTGFEVAFDALATTFAIARRRMVVPIHKKWEAGFTRIQVVRNEDKQVQLLAFFQDFQHGHCMNFLLKGTDVYESISKSGKLGIKFVDAKFPLSPMSDKEGSYDDLAFVCLDLPDLPGEHDDISVLFENADGKKTHRPREATLTFYRPRATHSMPPGASQGVKQSGVASEVRVAVDDGAMSVSTAKDSIADCREKKGLSRRTA